MPRRQAFPVEEASLPEEIPVGLAAAVDGYLLVATEALSWEELTEPFTASDAIIENVVDALQEVERVRYNAHRGGYVHILIPASDTCAKCNDSVSRGPHTEVTFRPQYGLESESETVVMHNECAEDLLTDLST